MRQENWITSDGGPLIFMEKRFKPSWGGINHCSVDDQLNVDNDYERACQGDKLVYSLPLKEGRAIVFGDMPLTTRFWPSDSSLLYVARLRWAEPTADVESMLSALDKSALHLLDDSTEIFAETPEFILFDAAESGEEDGPSISQALQPGTYRVKTYIFSPDDFTSFYLHEIAENQQRFCP